MSSLNLDLNYFDHPKTLRLVARLGPGADVLPIRLWSYVGRHHPESGCLEMLDYEIEYLCGWTGAKGEMIAAMIEIGFLKKESSFFRIHDWKEHSGHLAYFKERAVKAAKKRWGIKRKSSNATSNAKTDSKQCPSSSLHSSAVHSITPNTLSGENIYKRPEKTNPVNYLVMAYKLARGIPFDDRIFDKRWGRYVISAKQILEDCGGDLEDAERSLEKLARQFTEARLNWTLETVMQRVHETKIRRKNENGDSAGVFKSIAQPRSKAASAGDRGFVHGAAVLNAFRNRPVVSIESDTDIGAAK